MAAVGFKDVNIAEIGEGGVVGDDADETNLFAAGRVDAHAEGVFQRAGDDIAWARGGPVAAREVGVDSVEIETAGIVGNRIAGVDRFVGHGVGRWRDGRREHLQTSERGGEGGLVRGFEEGGAGDEGVGTGGTTKWGVCEIDAAVYFQSEGEVALATPGRELREFGQHVGTERLSAEARLHSHDEHEIDLVEERFYGRGGRIGVEDEASFGTE